MRPKAEVDAHLRAYRLYGTRVRGLLRITGMLQSADRSRASTYCSAFFIIVACSSMSAFIVNFACHIHNLSIMMKAMGLASSVMGPTVKTICFLAKRDSLIELDGVLRDLVEEELARNQETRAFVLSSLHMFDRLAYTLVFMMVMTVLLMIYPSLLSMVLQIVHRTEPRRYKLPYPLKFPWSVPSSGPLFYLYLLYELFVTWMISLANGSVDSLFGYYIFQITSVLRGASLRLTNWSTEEEYPCLLRTCLDKHRRLLRCRAILEDVYGLIILWPLLTNALVMCALMFDILTTQLTLSKSLSFFVYMTVKLVQTFTYAWYGSMITSESEAFRQAIYFSEWSYTGRNMRANIVIPMLQKPMTITVLKVCCVSVNMFTSILNTTLSYFFLLKAIDN